MGKYRDGSPRGWEARVGDLRITVHRHIDDAGGVFATCDTIGMSRHRIGDAPITEDHKVLALRAVRESIMQLDRLTSEWDLVVRTSRTDAP